MTSVSKSAALPWKGRAERAVSRIDAEIQTAFRFVGRKTQEQLLLQLSALKLKAITAALPAMEDEEGARVMFDELRGFLYGAKSWRGKDWSAAVDNALHEVNSAFPFRWPDVPITAKPEFTDKQESVLDGLLDEFKLCLSPVNHAKLSLAAHDVLLNVWRKWQEARDHLDARSGTGTLWNKGSDLFDQCTELLELVPRRSTAVKNIRAAQAVVQPLHDYIAKIEGEIAEKRKELASAAPQRNAANRKHAIPEAAS